MQFLYQETSRLTDGDLDKHIESVQSYRTGLRELLKNDPYLQPEASLALPSNKDLLKKVQDVVKEKVTNELEYVVDIGIGGSNLGTKAIYDALYGNLDILEPERYPKVIFADTNDPLFLHKLQQFIGQYKDKPERILLNAVTKSGATTETLVNLEALTEVLPLEVVQKRLVITTTPGTNLWNEAYELGLAVLPIPEKVGGRYSVFSPVSIFPLMCVGVDVEALVTGARDVRDQALAPNSTHDPSVLSASVLFESYQRGMHIHDLFFFHPELESLGKWYRQLLAESIGKKTVDKKQQAVGITPTVSIGSTDLHSIAQLYFGGPSNRLTTFVSTSHPHYQDVTLRTNLIFPNLINEIKNKSASEIMWAILEAVKIAYKRHELPFMEIKFDVIDERHLGQFMQHKMLEVMFLGQLFNVNAFDQPDVEEYKEDVKKILGRKGD